MIVREMEEEEKKKKSCCFRCSTGLWFSVPADTADVFPLSLRLSLRVSSVGRSRRTSIPPTPASTRAAASSTRSPATSASCAASRSASLWAWLWTVSHYTAQHWHSGLLLLLLVWASGTGHGSPWLTPPMHFDLATRLAGRAILGQHWPSGNGNFSLVFNTCVCKVAQLECRAFTLAVAMHVIKGKIQKPQTPDTTWAVIIKCYANKELMVEIKPYGQLQYFVLSFLYYLMSNPASLKHTFCGLQKYKNVKHFYKAQCGETLCIFYHCMDNYTCICICIHMRCNLI